MSRSGSTPSAEDALLADINGDGAYDVISSTEGDTQALYVEFAPENPADYLNSAAWSQVNLNGAVNAPVNNQYMFSVVNDLNGDGRPDIIAGGKEGSQLGYFTSTSGSVLNPANWTYHKLRDVGWTMSLLQYDFDHDGDLDVLLSTEGSGRTRPMARTRKTSVASIGWKIPARSPWLQIPICHGRSTRSV